MKIYRKAELAFVNQDIKSLLQNTSDATRQQVRLLAQKYIGQVKQALATMGELETKMALIEKTLEMKDGTIALPVRQAIRQAFSQTRAYELLAGAKYSPENPDQLLFNAGNIAQIETRVNNDVGQAAAGQNQGQFTGTEPTV